MLFKNPLVNTVVEKEIVAIDEWWSGGMEKALECGMETFGWVAIWGNCDEKVALSFGKGLP